MGAKGVPQVSGQSSLLEALRSGSAKMLLDGGTGTELERADTQGLGLLGLQERFEMLNGWLEIESVPGEGTTLIARVARG